MPWPEATRTGLTTKKTLLLKNGQPIWGLLKKRLKEMSHTPGIAVSSPTIDASIANCMAERAPT